MNAGEPVWLESLSGVPALAGRPAALHTLTECCHTTQMVIVIKGRFFCAWNLLAPQGALEGLQSIYATAIPGYIYKYQQMHF